MIGCCSRVQAAIRDSDLQGRIRYWESFGVLSDPTTSFSLLDRARSNDQHAWRQLVHLYGPLVHRWCKQSGLQDDDAADVFQETFRAVSTNLTSFTPQHAVGSFRSWLKTIARTKIVDHFRRHNRQPIGQGGSDAQQHLANVAEPLAEESVDDANEENALIVQRAMELIRSDFNSENWRSFQMVVVDGRAAVDVANELNVNVQKIRQANYRIRRRLRLVLQDLIDD